MTMEVGELERADLFRGWQFHEESADSKAFQQRLLDELRSRLDRVQVDPIAEVKRLTAEVERLRAAVRQAFDAVDWNSDGYNPGVARAILRAALTPDAES